MSDKDRISPYNINTIPSRQVMRIKKNIDCDLLVDPIPNSPNWHHKNCKGTVGRKTNEMLGAKGF